ncbi:MAG: DUF2007 domain-containing protein [Dysgonamonadaceae bacterium]|jgi:hypothetical protein|nr:DUF2007 domain-containing protein [Dysgonamonadaceae bacterium]
MDELITVKTFTYPHEAYILQSRLESDGISTFLKDEMTVLVNNFYSNAVGGVKLQVQDKDVETALAIIESSEKARDDEKTLAIQTSDKTHCPFCGSEEVAPKRNPHWLTFLPFILTMGFIFPFYKTTRKCFDCGKEWRIKKKA